MRNDKAESATDPILDKVLAFSGDNGLFDCGIIVVGLSGGPDSVALLTILKELKDRKDIDLDIVAFHCNHHLRPGICDDEADQVRALCERMGIELKVLDFDCAGFAKSNHISEETAGRILRYEAFEQYSKALEEKYKKQVRIAVAHHKDDLAETMMMNLFRGSGLEGLVNPKSRSGRIIRPLLCLNKKELTAFLDERGIGYATDMTNLTTMGTRNTWRNDIFPRIAELYGEEPSVPLARTYKLLSDDLDFISDFSFRAYAGSRVVLDGHPALKTDGIKDLHPAVKSRVLRLLWQETFGDLIDFEETNLKECAQLSCRDVSGEVTLDMPFGRKAYRHGDLFAYATENGVEKVACAIARKMGFLLSDGPIDLVIDLGDIPPEGDFSVEIPNSALKLKARIIENKGDLEYNNFLWFCPITAIGEGRITLSNSDGAGTGLHIRRAGSGGGKELKRLMTDLKIPESARRLVLFVRLNDDVLWLPGFGHSLGFTNEVSRERYIADKREEDVKSDRLVMFAIERKQ